MAGLEIWIDCRYGWVGLHIGWVGDLSGLDIWFIFTFGWVGILFVLSLESISVSLGLVFWLFWLGWIEMLWRFGWTWQGWAGDLVGF